jgi:hypothetical protein
MGGKAYSSSIGWSNLLLQLLMETALDIDLKMEMPPTPANGRVLRSRKGRQAAGEVTGSRVRTAEDRASTESA